MSLALSKAPEEACRIPSSVGRDMIFTNVCCRNDSNSESDDTNRVASGKEPTYASRGTVNQLIACNGPSNDATMSCETDFSYSDMDITLKLATRSTMR